MANARPADRPGRHVHQADVTIAIAQVPLSPTRPEGHTRSARVELGKEVVGRAFRLPCHLGGRERGPAVGAGEPPEAAVAQ